jgi:eukaryotic-like serine/threonine-protein kinase
MNELDLFAAALAIADPDQREALLQRECAGRPDLRSRIGQLLDAHFKSHPLLDQPAPEGGGGRLPPTVDYISPETAGAVIAGKYKLLQRIGEGGMGSVWMADQTEPVRRKVAVKLIRVERGQSQTILARFEAERQAIALMDHPHIARLLDAGTTESGSPFFVMELVKGVPLTGYCDTHKLSIPERLALFAQICSAVQHAHQKGIIHRDLKPTNILVESHDGKPVPKVIDFGLAKAASGLKLSQRTLYTAFGTVMGTPQYMAPEQATFNALDIDTRADIYALGVVLYELLTGTTPLTRATIKQAQLDEVLKLIREQEAPTPSSRLSTSESQPSVAANRQTEPARLGRLVRGELDWIVLKSLSKERERRYETASGFARDVERFLNHEVVTAGPPTAAYRLRKFVRRNRPQVIAASLVLLTLVAGVIGTTFGLVAANRAADAERTAKIDALEQKRLAEQAAEAERTAKIDALAQKHLAEQAAERERLAKVSEAQRAEGERKAKLEAQAKRQEAERNLAFAKKGNKILGSVFAGLDPKKIAESRRPLQDVLRRNLSKAEKELEGSAIGDPLEVAEMQDTLGISLAALGEATLAAEIFQKALDTRRTQLGPDHPETLNSMNNLALAYQAIGQIYKAVPLLEEVLERRKAKFGPIHRDTLASISNLANVYSDIGQLAKAVPLYEETLRKRKALLGPNHPDTLASMNNLSLAYDNTGQLAKAIPLYEQTFQKQQAILGHDHPYTLDSMNNLAGAYCQSGQLAKAIPLFEEVLQKRKTLLGPDHPDTLRAMNNLAQGYKTGGQLAKAVPLCEETFKTMKSLLGPDHPDTLISMNNLAAAHEADGQLDKALPLYEATLQKRKAALGPDHPQTLTSMSNLAFAYQASGRPTKAVPLSEEAAQGIEKRGFRHEHARDIVLSTIGAYEEAGQYDRADEWRQKWLGFVKNESGPESPAYAGELAAWGLSLLRRQNWTEAEAMLRECLTVREKAQPDTWDTFVTQSLLGGALLGQQKYAEAEPLLLMGYEGMKTREATIPQTDGGDLRIPEALDRLIELYIATDKPEEAQRWRTERAKYPENKPTGEQ